MKHVAPHRLADAARGRLADDDATAVAEHVEACERCERAMTRVRVAHGSMSDIAQAEPRGLRWDHIAARVHWSVSSDRRRRERVRGSWRTRTVRVGGVAALAAGVVVAALGLRPDATPAPAVAAGPAQPVAVAIAPEPSPLGGVVTMIQGEVEVAVDDVLRAGSALSTGRDGRVAVQFGADSGFALGPNSTVRIVALDEHRVQLSVEGRIDVRVSERLPGQHFGVIAGDREVVVRGTVFRVEHGEGEIGVTCTRGRVEVVGAESSIPVRAGEMLQLLDGVGVPQSISDATLAELYESIRVPLMPVWSGARGALERAGLVGVVATAPDDLVRIDGILVARGSAAMRLAPGRHRVALGDEPVMWRDLRAGEQQLAAIAPESIATSRRKGQSQRAPQLAQALRERERAVRACAAGLIKRGAADGGFAVLELAIDRAGHQRYLNVLQTNLPAAVSACVRDVVAEVEFPAGSAERVRKRVTF